MADRYKHLVRAFDDACRGDGPVRFMEIGTWKGKRALSMLRRAPSHVEVSYFGFDLFEDLTQEKKDEEFCGKAFPPKMMDVYDMLRTGTGKNVNVGLFKGDTMKTIPDFDTALSGTDFEYMDLIFIDGGHSIETIESDWNNVRRLIGPKTVVIFDDYFLEREDVGAKKTVESLRDDMMYEVEAPLGGDKDRKSGLTICFGKVTLK